jgi:hypothetical protein
VPFKSKAQRRKFAQLLVEGKIKDDTYEEWNRSTGRKALPERIHPRKGDAPKKRTAKKRTATKSTAKKRSTQSKKRSKR